MKIQKANNFNLYYIDDAFKFATEHNLNWGEIHQYCENNFDCYISYYIYFRKYEDAKFGINYLEGLLVFNKLMESI